MNWKAFVRNYLSFNRRERIGMIVLWILIMLVWLAPAVLPSFQRDTATDFSSIKKMAHELQLARRSKDSSRHISGQARSNTVITPFYFDPNILSEQEWKRLGIPARTIVVIRHYLSRGGHFYKKEDLQKIYGLKKAAYDRLEPYIRIAATEASPSFPRKKQPGDSMAAALPADALVLPVEINSADTSLFKTLRGIGSRLSQRIVRFRERLGGFYSIDQLKEVYALPDSVLEEVRPYLTLDSSAVQKININTADARRLHRHPYISYPLANAIVNYRIQHGPFRQVADLQNIALIDDQTYQKIAPYLVVQ